jgi:hypothetical protein
VLLALALILLPLVMGGVPFFAPAPEAGKKFPAGWRVFILVLGLMTAACAVFQFRADERAKEEAAREKGALSKELAALKTITPLRKETADLAKEILDFYNTRQHYTDRFTPGQTLSDKQVNAALKWHGETVRLFHANFERRIISVLNEIHVVTGMDVAPLEADAKRVMYPPQIEETATRLSAFAASLP